jgi:S-(hydroxymethyl)glutathione dehydrogenase / alcohol dehydrogenase
LVIVTRVYGVSYNNFPLGPIFDKGIKMRFGQSMPQRDIDDLVGWVEQGKIKLDDIITHRRSRKRRTATTFSTRKRTAA